MRKNIEVLASLLLMILCAFGLARANWFVTCLGGIPYIILTVFSILRQKRGLLSVFVALYLLIVFIVLIWIIPNGKISTGWGLVIAILTAVVGLGWRLRGNGKNES